MIAMNQAVPMAFAGTEGPAAYGEVISIGGLGPSVNGKLSSTIAEILETKLSIDSSRFYIKFYDVQVRLLRPAPAFCYGWIRLAVLSNDEKLRAWRAFPSFNLDGLHEDC